MRISELAKICEMTTSAIRYYERNGILPKPTRSFNGYRNYSEDIVKRLHTIKLAQELGFSLKEIVNAFDSSNKLNKTLSLQLLEEKRHDTNKLIIKLQAKLIQIDNLTEVLPKMWSEDECMDEQDVSEQLQQLKRS